MAFAAAEVGVADLFVGVDAAESAQVRRMGEGVGVGSFGVSWDGGQNGDLVSIGHPLADDSTHWEY